METITGLDFAAFEDIPPKPNRLNCLDIRINPSGHITLSPKMHQKMQWKRIMFRTFAKAEFISIRQCENEERFYSVPKTNAVKALDVTNELAKRGVRLPARYVMYWNSENEVWVGVIDKDYPKIPAAKKPRKKDVPDLKSLV